jgi:hypothetical protein
MTGGDSEFRWVGGVGRDHGVGLADDAGVKVTVFRLHGEVVDRALRNSFVRGHFGRSWMCGAQDEVAIFVRGGFGYFGEFCGGERNQACGGRVWGWVDVDGDERPQVKRRFS